MKKDTARIILNKDCPRKCPNCCNDYIDFSKIKKIDSLLKLKGKYDSFVLTGGEPMLYMYNLLHSAYVCKNFGSKVYVQTAYYSSEGSKGEELLSIIDGINYTLHDNATVSDLIRLELLVKDLRGIEGINSKLIIDSRLFEKINNDDMKLISDFSESFTTVQILEWKEDGDCPLPENEDLYILDSN